MTFRNKSGDTDGKQPRSKRAPFISNLTKIQRQTLGEQVYKELKESLTTARAVPGERLSLRGLAEAIGLSAMPVRAAVNRLVAENALEVLPNRTFRVPIMSRAKFIELRMIRVALEGLAAALAAERRSETDLAGIAAHLAIYNEESRRSDPDPALAILANRNFHFRIYEAASSPSLLLMIDKLWLQIGGVMNLALRTRPKRLRTVAAHRHHTALMEALVARDPAGAREALTGDIMSAGDNILAQDTLAE